MPQWLQGLIGGWPMIAANLPTFAFIVVILILAIWAACSWGYGRLISHKDAEIKLLERRLSEPKSDQSPQQGSPELAKQRSQFIKSIWLASDPTRPLQLSAKYAVTGVRIQIWVDVLYNSAAPNSTYPRFKIADLSEDKVVANAQLSVPLLSKDQNQPNSNEFYWGDPSLRNSIMDAQTFARVVVLGLSLGSPPQYFYFIASRDGPRFSITREDAMDWVTAWRNASASE